MKSFISNIRGHIRVEVLSPEGLVISSEETPNTLILEAPKIMLGNLIGPGLTGSSTEPFTNSVSGRPLIEAGGSVGPSSRLSVNYLKLGYVVDPDPVETIAVSASDLDTGATLTVTKLLTDAELGEYSIQLICSFAVTSSNEDRSYFEAALLCPALLPSEPSDMPDPEDPNSGYDESKQVLFAHQVHSPIQGSAGSTIRYTWTITMQEPS